MHREGRIPPASAPMAFMSDIHGNLTALEAVAGELQRRVISDVYVAGGEGAGSKRPRGTGTSGEEGSGRPVRTGGKPGEAGEQAVRGAVGRQMNKREQVRKVSTYFPVF